MGLTFSTNINVDKEAVQEITQVMSEAVITLSEGITEIKKEYDEEKEQRETFNKDMRENVDICVKHFLDARLLGCADLLKFGSKKEKCNEIEYELLQCATVYSKHLAERY
jgi:hypothetical protein